jgi:diguanylate cyclase (GGDEF)-like protein
MSAVLEGITRVLLIEDDTEYAGMLRHMLEDVESPPFRMDRAARLSSGLQRLASGEQFDVLLLDLTLEDSRGLDTIARVHRQAPHLPIIVLSALQDEDIAIQAVQHGVQDYLIKGQAGRGALVHALRNGIERQRVQAELVTLSLLDDLTGLYNRRGFRTLAEQQLRVAQRNSAEFLLLFFDLDRLKHINDSYGHAEGDRALIEISSVLRKSFRQSDIAARIGGDEFAVLAINATAVGAARMIARVRALLRACNANGQCRYPLSLSLGMARFEPSQFGSVEALLQKADRALYQQKRRKLEPASRPQPGQGESRARKVERREAK